MSQIPITPGSGRSPRKRNSNPLQYSCLRNPMDRGAWQAVVYGVAKESDMTETKQKQSITSSQSLFRHVHQDSNSNSGNQSSSTKSDSRMLKLLLFLRGDGLQSQCILYWSKVIWVHWTQSVSPKVLLEQLDSIISHSFFFSTQSYLPHQHFRHVLLSYITKMFFI